MFFSPCKYRHKASAVSQSDDQSAQTITWIINAAANLRSRPPPLRAPPPVALPRPPGLLTPAPPRSSGWKWKTWSFPWQLSQRLCVCESKVVRLCSSDGGGTAFGVFFFLFFFFGVVVGIFVCRLQFRPRSTEPQQQLSNEGMKDKNWWFLFPTFVQIGQLHYPECNSAITIARRLIKLDL